MKGIVKGRQKKGGEAEERRGGRIKQVPLARAFPSVDPLSALVYLEGRQGDD